MHKKSAAERETSAVQSNATSSTAPMITTTNHIMQTIVYQDDRLICLKIKHTYLHLGQCNFSARVFICADHFVRIMQQLGLSQSCCYKSHWFLIRSHMCQNALL